MLLQIAPVSFLSACVPFPTHLFKSCTCSLSSQQDCGRIKLIVVIPEIFKMQSDLLGVEPVLQYLSCNNLLAADFLSEIHYLVHMLVNINREHFHRACMDH